MTTSIDAYVGVGVFVVVIYGSSCVVCPNKSLHHKDSDQNGSVTEERWNRSAASLSWYKKSKEDRDTFKYNIDKFGKLSLWWPGIIFYSVTKPRRNGEWITLTFYFLNLAIWRFSQQWFIALMEISVMETKVLDTPHHLCLLNCHSAYI